MTIHESFFLFTWKSEKRTFFLMIFKEFKRAVLVIKLIEKSRIF